MNNAAGIRNRIAYVTLNGRIPSRSANSVGVMSMCGQFASLGLKPLLVVPSGQSTPLADLGYSGDVFSFYSIATPFEIKTFPAGPGARLSRFRFSYAFLLTFYVWTRRCALISTRNVEVGVWASWLGVPVVLESHNFSKFIDNRWISAWVRAARKRNDLTTMVVTTQAARSAYIELGIPERKIRVLPNAAQVERFQLRSSVEALRRELGLPEAGSVAAFSGSLGEGRGGDEMLACAERLRDVHFLLVGGSPADASALRHLVERRGLDNVTITGHVPQDRVPRYLLAADVLLMPYTTRFSAHSFEYTSPMKMFEYLATGKPMVASDFPILHEVLEHGRNAVFVAPDSGQALAEGIRFLLDNPEKARAIGAAAKADAQRYTWKNRAQAVIDWQRGLGNLD